MCYLFAIRPAAASAGVSGGSSPAGLTVLTKHLVLLGDILRGMAEGREVGCPSQKLNLGADNADFVPSRGRGRVDSMAG